MFLYIDRVERKRPVLLLPLLLRLDQRRVVFDKLMGMPPAEVRSGYGLQVY
ncbi:hypothetical protein E4U55_000503 [Claviceps digitariae]|nr:hypothetical protein E4U55_000503 [Claviceps digitariae]